MRIVSYFVFIGASICITESRTKAAVLCKGFVFAHHGLPTKSFIVQTTLMIFVGTDIATWGGIKIKKNHVDFSKQEKFFSNQDQEQPNRRDIHEYSHCFHSYCHRNDHGVGEKQTMKVGWILLVVGIAAEENLVQEYGFDWSRLASGSSYGCFCFVRNH